MAHKMDMTNGEYVYIVVDQLPSKHVFTPWVAGDDQDETARLAFESVLQVLVQYCCYSEMRCLISVVILSQFLSPFVNTCPM